MILVYCQHLGDINHTGVIYVAAFRFTDGAVFCLSLLTIMVISLFHIYKRFQNLSRLPCKKKNRRWLLCLGSHLLHEITSAPTVYHGIFANIYDHFQMYLQNTVQKKMWVGHTHILVRLLGLNIRISYNPFMGKTEMDFQVL